MPNKSRSTVDGKQGYTIKKLVVIDGEGNVLEELFELYDPSGELVGTFLTLEKAEEALDQFLRPSPPSQGMRM